MNIINLDRKYRPTKFEDFIGNSNIVRDIQALLKVGDMPHFMFIGPPGSGKTTMAYLIARYYLGRPISVNTRDGDEDFIELNASDERGIDTIREKVQLFAKTRSETTGKKRIILLDEADSLTKEAQHALRPIVEKNEDRCIFIFSLNRIQGIQEPALISRCATFFFKRPEIEDCKEFFEKIAELEGVIFEKEELIYDVVKYYQGDLRHMLNDCLEALKGFEPNIDHYGHKYIQATEDHLWKIYEQNGKSVAKRVFESATPRKTFFDIYRKESFDVRNFLEEYYDLLGEDALKFSKIFAKIDARLRMYASEVIQMNYLFSVLGE